MHEWQVGAEVDSPLRLETNRLYRFSKVLENHLDAGIVRALPQCPHLVWANPVPLNQSAPGNLYQSQKLLALIEEEVNVLHEGHHADNTIKGTAAFFPVSKNVPAYSVE